MNEATQLEPNTEVASPSQAALLDCDCKADTVVNGLIDMAKTHPRAALMTAFGEGKLEGIRMSGGSALRRELDKKTFREMEQMMKDIKKEALKKMAHEYPIGVLVFIRHGLEERKAYVYDHSKHEMKIRVRGKTGTYWIDTHRVIKAVCPECEREDWKTAFWESNGTMPDTTLEVCHDCGYQWGHR